MFQSVVFFIKFLSQEAGINFNDVECKLTICVAFKNEKSRVVKTLLKLENYNAKGYEEKYKRKPKGERKLTWKFDKIFVDMKILH